MKTPTKALILCLFVLIFLFFVSNGYGQEVANGDSTQVIIDIADEEENPEEFLAEIATNALEKEQKKLKIAKTVGVVIVGYLVVNKIREEFH